MKPKIVVYLTTCNRPVLLRQCLQSLLNMVKNDQSEHGMKLIDRVVISDDDSTEDVKEMLRQFVYLSSDGVTVDLIHHRRAGADGHQSQVNNIVDGFEFIVRNYPDTDFILKVDDDVVFIPAALERMYLSYLDALACGHRPITAGGMKISLDSDASDFDRGWLITGSVFQAFVLWPMKTIVKLVEVAREEWAKCLGRGWDVFFDEEVLPMMEEGKSESKPRYVVCHPAVNYGTSVQSGVHSMPYDLNPGTYMGSLEGVVRV